MVDVVTDDDELSSTWIDEMATYVYLAIRLILALLVVYWSSFSSR